LGKDKGIILEYFGLQGDRDYDELSERKRDFWKAKDGWIFLEYSPTDIAHLGVDGFRERLLHDLSRFGVPTRKRTDEEIWDLIRQRAIDRFTTAIRSFVSRCRKSNLSEAGLENKVQAHLVSSPGEKAFLDAAVSIYRGYLEKLKANHKEDFDGLMWRAIELVNSGQTRFARNKGQERGDLKKLRFILIDEFQDFSQMFYQLSMAIRNQNTYAQFFCVGDDWQAINEFAGSELTFFLNFSYYFKRTSKYYISSNYRSPSLVVQIGNALMSGLGKSAVASKAVPGDVFLCPVDKLNLTAIEQSIHNGDEITPAVLRLIRHYLSLGKNIVLLSRRNGLPWYVNYPNTVSASSDSLQKFREQLLRFIPEEDHKLVQISTTHKYKGEEDSVIIVVDAVERHYPLIHPSWIFLRVFGESIDNIEAAERRLFYVALTRPKEALLIITESNQASPYLRDIEKHLPLKQIDWNKYSPPPSLNGEHVEVRVKNAYDVKEDLKRRGFRWNAKGSYWYRTFPREGFDFEGMLQQSWVNQNVEIRVYSEKQDLLNQLIPGNVKL
jgi:DNA helicase-4